MSEAVKSRGSRKEATSKRRVARGVGIGQVPPAGNPLLPNSVTRRDVAGVDEQPQGVRL